MDREYWNAAFANWRTKEEIDAIKLLLARSPFTPPEPDARQRTHLTDYDRALMQRHHDLILLGATDI